LISDLAILVALINSSLLLVITGFGIQKIQNYVETVGSKSGTQAAKSLGRSQIFIQVIYFFLIIGILSRLFYIFMFPYEFNEIQQPVSLSSLAVIWVVLQTLFLAFYVFLLIILIITQNLIPRERNPFITKVLKISLFIFLFDILISFIMYILVTVNNLLPWLSNVAEQTKAPITTDFSNAAGLAVLFNLILFLIVFFIKLRLDNKILSVSYNVLFILTLGIDIVVLLYGLSATLSNTAGFLLFTAANGFAAQIWLFLVFITIGLQGLISIILKLDSAFMNSNYGSNLRIQLRNITVAGLMLLSLIAIWIPLLKIMYG